MNGTELFLYELGKQKVQEAIENSERRRMFTTQKSRSSRFSLKRKWDLSSGSECT
ncbi:MAG: hypothetical protein HXS52_08445 [Theionarchaea archaeon]|nr:hypothetical protein [Theionarchaea archaeon]